MKKLLMFLGSIFLIIIVAFGTFAGYAAYNGNRLDRSSRAYVESNIPPILSTWSKSEIIKRASPELLKALKESPEQCDQLLQKLSGLGAMKSFGNIVGDSNVYYSITDKASITANYTAVARFENGEANLKIRLIQLSGQWKLLLININSPILNS